MAEIDERLAAAEAAIRNDINDALGLRKGMPAHVNVEVKYGAPDAVIIDVSETGWAETVRHPCPGRASNHVQPVRKSTESSNSKGGGANF